MTTPPRLTGDDHVTGYDPTHAAALRVGQDEAFEVETRDRFGALPGGGDRCELPGNLVGPVYIEGVKSGDVMMIRIVDIEPLTGSGVLLASPGYGILGAGIDTRARTVAISRAGVSVAAGVCVPYRPMIGKLGVQAAGPADGTATGEFGGALSATQMGPGAALLVRAAVDGGGVLLEDVHACMGDGEATASAVEMPARVTLSCTVMSVPPETLPMLMTEHEAIVFGEGETLDAAVGAANGTALAVLQAARGIDLTEAAFLVGAAVDLRVSFIGARPARARAAIPRVLVGR